MAAIYDMDDGSTITEGLQGSNVCDEAMQAARRIAARREETVLLVDDDGHWLVRPDGSFEALVVDDHGQ